MGITNSGSRSIFPILGDRRAIRSDCPSAETPTTKGDQYANRNHKETHPRPHGRGNRTLPPYLDGPPRLGQDGGRAWRRLARLRDSRQGRGRIDVADLEECREGPRRSSAPASGHVGWNLHRGLGYRRHRETDRGPSDHVAAPQDILWNGGNRRHRGGRAYGHLRAADFWVTCLGLELKPSLARTRVESWSCERKR